MGHYVWPKKIVVTCSGHTLREHAHDGPLNVYANEHDSDKNLVIGGYQRVYALVPIRKKKKKTKKSKT
jgi:hypothetical protein